LGWAQVCLVLHPVRRRLRCTFPATPPIAFLMAIQPRQNLIKIAPFL